MFTPQDLTYLEAKRYRKLMKDWIAGAEEVKTLHALRCDDPTVESHVLGNTYRDYLIRYRSLSHYLELARDLSPMIAETRGNAGRASYNGTVMVRCRGHRLFLTPA